MNEQLTDNGSQFCNWVIDCVIPIFKLSKDRNVSINVITTVQILCCTVIFDEQEKKMWVKSFPTDLRPIHFKMDA